MQKKNSTKTPEEEYEGFKIHEPENRRLRAVFN